MNSSRPYSEVANLGDNDAGFMPAIPHLPVVMSRPTYQLLSKASKEGHCMSETYPDDFMTIMFGAIVGGVFAIFARRLTAYFITQLPILLPLKDVAAATLVFGLYVTHLYIMFMPPEPRVTDAYMLRELSTTAISV